MSQIGPKGHAIPPSFEEINGNSGSDSDDSNDFDLVRPAAMTPVSAKVFGRVPMDERDHPAPSTTEDLLRVWGERLGSASGTVRPPTLELNGFSVQPTINAEEFQEQQKKIQTTFVYERIEPTRRPGSQIQPQNNNIIEDEFDEMPNLLNLSVNSNHTNTAPHNPSLAKHFPQFTMNSSQPSQPMHPPTPSHLAVPPKQSAPPQPPAEARSPDEELRFAARSGSIDLARKALEAGAEVDCSSKRGFTPFISACAAGHLAVAELLLESGCDRELETVDGTTGLFEAVRKGHFQVVKMLMKAGCNINTPDLDGFSPLYIAFQEGHDELVRLLLSAGAERDGLSDTQRAIHDQQSASIQQKLEQHRLSLRRQLNSATAEMSAVAIEVDNATYKKTAEGVLDTLKGHLESVKDRVKMLQTKLVEYSDTSAQNYAAAKRDNDFPHARLEEWFLLSDARFEGKVFGKLGFVDGKITRTSRVLDSGKINIDNGVIQTKSGTRYTLGAHCFGPVVDHWEEVEGGALQGLAFNFPGTPDGTPVTTTPVAESNRHGSLFITSSGVKLQIGVKKSLDVGWQVLLIPENKNQNVVRLHHGYQVVGRGLISGVTDSCCDAAQFEVFVDRVQLSVSVRRLGVHPSCVWQGSKMQEMQRYLTYKLANMDKVGMVEKEHVFQLRVSMGASVASDDDPRAGFEED